MPWRGLVEAVCSCGRKMEQVCKDGIEDNLDPGCVGVFRKALAHSYQIMTVSMREMQGEVCPANWREGEEAMKPTSDGVAR